MNLRRVFFINDKVGWIAGDFGTVLHTTDGGLILEENSTSVTNINNSIWISFPFLNISLKREYNVVIKIFDISGRNIVPPFGCKLKSGISRLALPVKGLKKGIYFIYLKSDKEVFKTKFFNF